jgi:AraC-like DNA-binding protein
MLAHCGELSIDGDAMLAAIAIARADLDDPDARVPIAAMHAACDWLAARLPRDDGALLGAERYTPSDYGLVGLVVMTSATVEEALCHFIRYSRLWTDEPLFVRDGTVIRLAYRTAFPDSPGKRISTEAAFTEIVQGARLVTRTRFAPRAVRYAHAAPRDPKLLATFFGCEVEFGAGANELELRAEDLALPLPRGDAQLLEHLRAAANHALARRDRDPAAPIERARSIVADELARAVPSLDVVAKRMALSPRTLRRRLADDGTSFRELLDETRAQLARSYVRDRRIALAEVAFLLGFSEPSAFHRAFKRWTGTTPAAFRASPTATAPTTPAGA